MHDRSIVDARMFYPYYCLFSVFLVHAVAAAAGIDVTPQESYSSSAGVLGCKINTNRVAYWPSAVSCDDLCVRVSYAGRNVSLLRIDTSASAYDISYDAWNYLFTGYSAAQEPATGGAISATYENVTMDDCLDLLDSGRLPLSAANGMRYLGSCLGASNSWLANNYVLYNILNQPCTYGVDEVCTLNWPESNQPVCSSGLGNNSPLYADPVHNIEYGTGKEILAS